MCSVLKVSRSGFYAWRRRPTPKRTTENDRLKKKIREIFSEHKKRYGVPRVYDELKRQGFSCSKNRVERLMKEMNLRAEGKKPFRVTTNSKHKHNIAPNIVNRYFETSAPNQIWTGDITYVRTIQGWLYLAVVIDLFSRKVIGWCMDKHLGSSLAVNALKMALAQRKPSGEVIFHSDRGVQYASHFFQRTLSQNALIQSMSRKGDCWDNAPTESFFATLKKELIRNELYSTREIAKTEIFRYIEGYYNIIRLHSFNDQCPPQEFEEDFYKGKIA
jgi:transposase InsO family protein